jgi:hypothetical protein
MSGSITSDQRADLVITRLRMLRDNREWVSWLRGEQTMSFAVGENAYNIKLIDFIDPEANDYLCTNQAWMQGVERRRPDILPFLNGIPMLAVLFLQAIGVGAELPQAADDVLDPGAEHAGWWRERNENESPQERALVSGERPGL